MLLSESLAAEDRVAVQQFKEVEISRRPIEVTFLSPPPDCHLQPTKSRRTSWPLAPPKHHQRLSQFASVPPMTSSPIFSSSCSSRYPVNTTTKKSPLSKFLQATREEFIITAANKTALFSLIPDSTSPSVIDYSNKTTFSPSPIALDTKSSRSYPSTPTSASSLSIWHPPQHSDCSTSKNLISNTNANPWKKEIVASANLDTPKSTGIAINDDKAITNTNAVNPSCSSAVAAGISSNSAALTCDICKKCFTSRSNLNKHKRVQHSGEEHMCPICFRSFKNRYYIKDHLNICTAIHTKRQQAFATKIEASNIEISPGNYSSSANSSVEDMDVVNDNSKISPSGSPLTLSSIETGKSNSNLSAEDSKTD